jgi:hypothetical protein
MVDIQNYLQELLAIDCDLQTNLQNLLLVSGREELDAKSGQIKRGLKSFKEKLKEMKDYCDLLSSYHGSSSSSLTGVSSELIERLNRNFNKTRNSAFGSSGDYNPSSSKDVFMNELQIQKERLSVIETRFRNAYMAAQVKLDQLERDSLLNNDPEARNKANIELKKRNLSNQLLLKQSTDITNKLSEINKQLKWTENQTSDIIPVLDETSKKINNTNQELNFMNTVIKDGKRLLTRLSRREFTDKLLIILCLCFFFSVVFYIIWKRLL